ncbi:hypothetical protein DFJ58DRAFT_7429 [Suillus subalutaceus]|uniref:uncharacterized protein n=1 Tax=Suillus subalutaceus TaxID=48586 RepID=UPI001B874150|nr:uncharacterized protein DFJ58DRAFT_7429 [Suillus subalutaceus]KAG1877808.1 hypothetical protein DFJ58DRAFT_7429 [Suillus subalutaceus]
MAHSFEIFFTGRDDPRNGCIVIGEDTKPVFFEFETQYLSPSSARTTISSNRNPVAALHWMNGGLGVATIGDREIPMAHLVQQGSSTSARRFPSADGRHYEWRKCHADPRSYEVSPPQYFKYRPLQLNLQKLFSGPNTRIAKFQKLSQATPIGPSHGTLQYSFSHDLLLLEALVTLNLNRWLDWTG